jgi:hypothetical protein
MTLWYTPFDSDTGVNALELNERLTEISEKGNDLISGSDALTTPQISSFVNAVHDHEDAAGGGQLGAGALNSGAATDGQVLMADGAGVVAWETPVETFLDLSDTLNDYTGLGGLYLRVNPGETAVEAGSSNLPNIEEVTQDEVGNHTTSSTSMVDINSIRLSLDVTVQTGSRGIEVYFEATIRNSGSGNVTYFDAAVDGNRDAGDSGICFQTTVTGGSTNNVVTFQRYIPLAPGTYTIRPQWRVNGGTTTMWAGSTSGADVHPQFSVKEVI